MPDLRESIRIALQSLDSSPLRSAAVELLSILGYSSDRTIDFGNSAPQNFLEFVRSSGADAGFSETKALTADWKSVDLLFQLTDAELSGQSSLFKETSIHAGLLQSYLFFAIELKGGDYARGKLTGLARQINRVFPMPVMVLIKHVTEKRPVLSIAVINRRQSKRDAAKDVLGKVTIIRDISLLDPHRGHLDILASFAIPNLVHPQRLPINNFDTLHAAWEEIFNVELLNKRFYRELANWYFWALPQVEFPADIEKDDEKRRATGLIRLLTRLIFCWFLKEKGLIPETLFVEAELKKILKDLSPNVSTYNEAILQNLFFATLNQRMGKDAKGHAFRAFAKDEGFLKNRATYGVDTLYRYEEHFREPAVALNQFADVPFLNGGLFECLDRTEEGTNKKLYLDGFSRNKRKRPTIPNRLFFDSEHEEDLSEAYGDTKRKREQVRGLLRILHSYKFTIVENTPIDQEIALDPELLGKVFENLLASYNEETKTTARKQTGSFYTPRPIVEYMVDESLKAHLTGAIIRAGMAEHDAQAGLDILFAYTEREHPFTEREVATLLDAIHTCKILDPACGSGAFPMGMLQKLVYIIHKLDPDNARWKQLQIDTAATIPDALARDAAIAAIESDFADNEDDYGRKLYLIENCLYGVDIQPIAIQLSKLRFFISLVCDQRTNRSKKDNHGIRPLPNLETKFVAADTLIGLPQLHEGLVHQNVYKIESEIETLYHGHFAIQRRDQKLALQKKIKDLRKELGVLLADSLGSSKKAQHIADWDPFDPQASSDFFDSHWMFGRSLAHGFDIVLGNPPYIQLSKTEWATAEYIATLKTRYGTAGGRANTFVFFIHLGLDLMTANGTMSYIVPNTLLTQDYYEETRRLLLSQRLRSLVQYTRLPFEHAVVENITFVVSKETPAKDHTIAILEDNLSEANQLTSKSQNAFLANRNAAITIYSAAIADEVFARELPTLDSMCHVNQAIALKGDRTLSLRTTNPDGRFFPVLDGRNIAKYAVRWDGVYLEYDESRIHSCKRQDIFLSPEKLLFRRVSEDLMCAYDDRQFFALNTLVVVNPKEGHSASLKYLLAVLNSSLMNYLYKKRFKSTKRVFSEIQARSVGQLPIAPAKPAVVATVAALATLLIAGKADDSGSVSSALGFLEDLIDACVLECYFRTHMAERRLLFLDDLSRHLSTYNPIASKSQQREFIAHFHRTLNAPSSNIRNLLLRISADSPDLLAVIKEEGML
jgi:type I restriction-modification system DNA methylase subunit